MQKTFKFAVTVGRSENVALEKLAQTWAAKFGVKYVERGSRGSLGFLLDQERVEALLVATNKGPQVYTASGTFFFHPSMAVFLEKVSSPGPPPSKTFDLIESLTSAFLYCWEEPLQKRGSSLFMGFSLLRARGGRNNKLPAMRVVIIFVVIG